MIKILLTSWMISQNFSADLPVKVPFSLEEYQQDSRIQELIKKYYPNEKDPGISILYAKKNDIQAQLIQGMGDVANAQPLLPESRFRMASVSKQFTAFSIYKLINEGKLHFDTLLSEIFQNTPEEFENIQVIHLLQHSSGIQDYEDLIPSTQKVPVSDHDVWNMVANAKDPHLYFSPGSNFRYSNTGYCLLALITEKVAGIPYEDYMRINVFKPVGIEQATIYTSDIEIQNRAFGYRILADGEARFNDQSITSSTKGDGCVYINKAEYLKWIKTLFSNPYPLRANGFSVNPEISYSLGWFYTANGLRFHSGETSGFRNFVYYDEVKDETLIVFSNRNENKIADFVDELMKLLELENPASSQPLMTWMSKVYNGDL